MKSGTEFNLCGDSRFRILEDGVKVDLKDVSAAMLWLLHPGLINCRRLFLRDHEVMVDIGAYESEKQGKQRLFVNIDVFVPLADSTPQDDQLHEVIDYNFMRDAVTTRTALGHIHLQETLCDDLARAMLQHPKVQAVRISTEKPDAYSDCSGVGVEVVHIK